MEKNKTILSKKKCIVLLIIALLVLIIVSIVNGAAEFSYREFSEIFFGTGISKAKSIILYVRLPRVIGAVVTGAGLAMAGAIIQVVLHNPLAGPSIIGVNAGAEFAVVFSSLFLPKMFGLYPVFAFLGAFLTVMLVFGIGKRAGASKLTIVLAGVAVNSLLKGFTDGLYSISETTLISGNAFKMGGLSSINIQVLKWASIIIGVSIFIMILLSRELEIFSLGDEMAKTLGLSVKLYRFLFLILAAAMAGASVSLAGILGFVGLMSPHIVRIFFGTEDIYYLIGSALVGSILLLFCDLLARNIFTPYEISVGIVLSVIGAPFFLWMLLGKRRREMRG